MKTHNFIVGRWQRIVYTRNKIRTHFSCSVIQLNYYLEPMGTWLEWLQVQVSTY